MFVALEGPDSIGKTTIANMLSERKTNYSVYTTKEPGSKNVDVCHKIREILLESDHIYEETELFLFLADRIEHYHKEIKPALNKYDFVVTDRYALSTAIYQMQDDYINDKSLRQFFNKLHGYGSVPYPDLTLVFKGSFDTIKDRMPDDKDRIENKGEEYHQNIINNFDKNLNDFYPNVDYIDAEKSKQEVFHSVYDKIVEYYINNNLSDNVETDSFY